MDPKKLDLKQAAQETTQIDRIVARLEGELDDKVEQIWGEEFLASGGKPPAPPPVGGIVW